MTRYDCTSFLSPLPYTLHKKGMTHTHPFVLYSERCMLHAFIKPELSHPKERGTEVIRVPKQKLNNKRIACLVYIPIPASLFTI